MAQVWALWVSLFVSHALKSGFERRYGSAPLSICVGIILEEMFQLGLRAESNLDLLPTQPANISPGASRALHSCSQLAVEEAQL